MIRQAPPGSGGESGPRAKTRRGKPNDPPGPGRLVGRAVSRQPPVRERTEQDRDGRPARTFRDDGRRAGGDGSGRAHAGGYRREKGRNDASAAEAASGRHFAGRGEGRPAAGARPERRPSKPRVPQQERWQLVSPLLPEPDAALREGLDLLGAALARIRPLAAAHARSLPQDVAALSRLLTVERAHLHQPYWASPALISAYLYYFLPWNVLRQARLLSALPLPDPRIWLEQGRRPLLLDMGSGPLSLPIALWLARPEWRALPLSVLALDASSQPLELGRELLRALAEIQGRSAWEIRTVRAPLGQAARQLARTAGQRPPRRCGGGRPRRSGWLRRPMCSMRCFPAAEPGARDGVTAFPPGRLTTIRPRRAICARTASLASGWKACWTVSRRCWKVARLRCLPRCWWWNRGPAWAGRPSCVLRGAALERGLVPLAPCTHAADCPLERGRSGRGWCHMTFDCAGAPDWLVQLSEAAGLAKDSLSLAPLLLSTAAETVQDGLDAREAEAAGADGLLARAALRVLSAPFAVPGLPGRARYACGVGGLALLGDAECLPSGGLVEAQIPEQPRFDRRSGALLLLPETEAPEEAAPASRPSEKPFGRQRRERRPDHGERSAQERPEHAGQRKPKEGRPYPSARQTPRGPRTERQDHGRRPERTAGDRPPRRKPS